MWHWWLPLQHWLAIRTGTDNEPGPYYGFWSGFAGDLGLFTATAAFSFHAFASYRHKNCHVHRCPRIAHLPVEGTPWRVCKKHAPTGAPTHGEVIAAHEAARNATGES